MLEKSWKTSEQNLEFRLKIQIQKMKSFVNLKFKDPDRDLSHIIYTEFL